MIPQDSPIFTAAQLNEQLQREDHNLREMALEAATRSVSGLANLNSDDTIVKRAQAFYKFLKGE